MVNQLAIFFLIIAVIVAMVSAVIVLLFAPAPAPERPIACTLDAKICPDGTNVGRIPPSCEFEECPPYEEPETPVENLTENDVVEETIVVEPVVEPIENETEEDPCDVWIGLDKKAECYSLLAQEKEDLSICEKIEVVNYKDICYKGYALELRDIDSCFLLDGDMEESCITAITNWANNYSICLEIPEDTQSHKDMRDECLMRYGKGDLDEAACKEIAKASKRDECLRYIANELEGLERCLMLKEENLISGFNEYECFNYAAIDAKDPGICTHIEKQISYRIDCIKDTVQMNRLMSNRCVGLEIDDEYLCRAIAERDDTFCDMIDDHEISSWCYDLWTSGQIEGGVFSECEDTDGGIDYAVKGETRWTQTIGSEVGTGTSFEYCSGNTLVEFYCLAERIEGYEHIIGESYYTCPNGCSNGACI